MEYKISKGIGYEYEVQLFGFTPKSFVDGIYNAVMDYIGDCFAELENVLNNEPDLCQASTPKETRKATEKAMENFFKTSDKIFDRFELYVMENIFKIPANALLPEDKVHTGYHYTAEDEKAIDLELHQLQQKIKAAKYVNSALKQEVKDLDQAQEQMNACEEWWGRVNKFCKNASGALKDNLEFSSSQANRLNSSLKTLKAFEDIQTPIESNKESLDVTGSKLRRKVKH